MAKQIYKSAQGKSVDLGTIKLRNEHVRAVGNMNVNARGDVLDSNNQVIDKKSSQIQRQNARLTNISDAPVHTSTSAAKRARANQQSTDSTDSLPAAPITAEPEPQIINAAPAPEPQIINAAPAPVEVIDPVDPTTAGGGLAAAIARSKVIKQEKEKTARQLQQDTPGVRKI